jgi:response regulator PhyR-like protein/sigma-70-like protein
MNPLAEAISPMLPGLHRYACALTGDQCSGDWYVRIALETLLQEPFRVRADEDVKFQLYQLLGDALSVDGMASLDVGDEAESEDILEQGLHALPLLTRHLFLLVTLEGFSVRRAAELFGIAEDEANSHLAWVRKQLRGRLGEPLDPALRHTRAHGVRASKPPTPAPWQIPAHPHGIGRELVVQSPRV